ncbi:MAG TPA: hypothetical protein VL974_08965 [Magnetospirillum sp.]|nr:hypothetical protein [Magnetospirillum sp.]
MSAKVVGGLLAGVVVLAGLMALLLGLLGGTGRSAPSTLPNQALDFPAPRLRIEPLDEPKAYAAEKAPLLHRWGWADNGHTLAHIPIEEAQRLVVERGWR